MAVLHVTGLPSMPSMSTLCFKLRVILSKCKIEKFRMIGLENMRGCDLKEANIEFLTHEDAVTARSKLDGFEFEFYDQSSQLKAVISKQSSRNRINSKTRRSRNHTNRHDHFERQYSRERDKSRSPVYDTTSKLDVELTLLKKQREIIEEERRLILECKKLELIKEFGASTSMEIEKLDQVRERSREREREFDRDRDRGLCPQRDRGLGLQRDRDLGPQRDRGFGPQRDRGLGPQRDRGLAPQRDRGLAPQRDRGLGLQRDRDLDSQRDRDLGRQRDRDLGPQRDRDLGPQRDRDISRQWNRDRGPQRDRGLGPQRDRGLGPQRDRGLGNESDGGVGRQRDREVGRQQDRGVGLQRDRDLDRQQDRDFGRRREHERDRFHSRERDRNRLHGQPVRARSRDRSRDHDRDRRLRPTKIERLLSPPKAEIPQPIYKLPKFIYPCKLITRDLKPHVDKLCKLGEKTALHRLLNFTLRKRITMAVKEDDGRTTSEDIYIMYRDLYPVETDEEFIQSILKKIRMCYWVKHPVDTSSAKDDHCIAGKFTNSDKIKKEEPEALKKINKVHETDNIDLYKKLVKEEVERNIKAVVCEVNKNIDEKIINLITAKPKEQISEKDNEKVSEKVIKENKVEDVRFELDKDEDVSTVELMIDGPDEEWAIDGTDWFDDEDSKCQHSPSPSPMPTPRRRRRRHRPRRPRPTTPDVLAGGLVTLTDSFARDSTSIG